MDAAQGRIQAFHESFVMLTVLCLLAFAGSHPVALPGT